MAPVMAGVYGATGSQRTFIVRADDGLDELSVTSPSTILDHWILAGTALTMLFTT